MTDEQINQLMERAREGDNDAQDAVDKWIAEALAALCATPPLSDERIVEMMGYDEAGTCQMCAEVFEVSFG